ncbi:MAG TPA: hypothetical protein VH062_07620 [Polyangiaceae bacterium]|jgi:hypothetical protein|nr:hypothetical protein [Polyangiaceae bacterium]
MDLSNLPSTRQAPPDQKQIHHRTGLLQLVIGASAVVRGADGVRRYYTANSRADVVHAAKAEGRTIKTRVIDLTTGRMHESLEDLRRAYPDPVSMKLSGAFATWAYFSDDPQDPEQASKVDALEKEITGRRAVIVKLRAALAKPDSIEQFDELRGKVAAQERGIEEAGKEIARLRDAIVGLMSDELHPHELPPDRTQATITSTLGA